MISAWLIGLGYIFFFSSHSCYMHEYFFCLFVQINVLTIAVKNVCLAFWKLIFQWKKLIPSGWWNEINSNEFNDDIESSYVGNISTEYRTVCEWSEKQGFDLSGMKLVASFVCMFDTTLYNQLRNIRNRIMRNICMYVFRIHRLVQVKFRNLLFEEINWQLIM